MQGTASTHERRSRGMSTVSGERDVRSGCGAGVDTVLVARAKAQLGDALDLPGPIDRRLAEMIALQQIDALLPEQSCFGAGLDPFRDGGKAEPAGEPEQMA